MPTTVDARKQPIQFTETILPTKRAAEFAKFLTLTIVLIAIPDAQMCAGEAERQEVRELSTRAEVHGTRSLAGLTCSGVYQFRNRGNSRATLEVAEASVVDDLQWLVRFGEGPTKGAYLQNGRLGVALDFSRADQVTMPSYGFGASYRDQQLVGAAKFFTPLTSGSHLHDVPFTFVVDDPGFSCSRSSNDDETSLGRCWAWAIGEDSQIPPCTGKVWFLEFDDGIVAISKLTQTIREGDTRTIVNQFSKSQQYPALIEQTQMTIGNTTRQFRINSIHPISDPPEAFTPEYYGVARPADPRRIRLIFVSVAIAGALGFAFFSWRIRLHT